MIDIQLVDAKLKANVPPVSGSARWSPLNFDPKQDWARDKRPFTGLLVTGGGFYFWGFQHFLMDHFLPREQLDNLVNDELRVM